VAAAVEDAEPPSPQSATVGTLVYSLGGGMPHKNKRGGAGGVAARQMPGEEEENVHEVHSAADGRQKGDGTSRDHATDDVRAVLCDLLSRHSMEDLVGEVCVCGHVRLLLICTLDAL
jgi:hypothetical protein